jgi:predicted kinase
MNQPSSDSLWEEVPNKRKKSKKSDREKNEVLSWLEGLSHCADPKPFQPNIVLMVGLPGSGKSTFATVLAERLPWKYVRINQDELGSREQCLAETEIILSRGLCPIIDRCNVSRVQRKHFLELASVTNREIDCICLCIPREDCHSRCRLRHEHPTLKPYEVASVLKRMESEWEPPTTSEGFRRVRSNETNAEFQRELHGLLMC